VTTTTTYTADRGKPPAHTRFQSGQSDHSTGKPGPAKLLRARFQRALYAALEMPTPELEQMQPDSAVEAIAANLVLDAVAGRAASRKQLLSLLDKETAREEAGEAEIAEALPAQNKPQRNATSGSSLLQGEYEGGEENRGPQICAMPDAEKMPRQLRREADERPTANGPSTAANAAKREPPPERIPIRAASPLAEKLLQGTSCLPGFGPGGSHAWTARAQGP